MWLGFKAGEYMKIKVNKNEVSIEYEADEVINCGEYKIHKCYFDFSEEYQGLTKKAIFETSMIKKEMPIIDNECHIPYEVLNSERINLRVYAYSIENDELILRYSPKYSEFYTLEGSYIEGAEPSEEITPTQFEQYVDALNKGLNKVDETLEVIEKNESERIENEISRNKSVESAINTINDMKEDYNENAIQKTQTYNDNANQKIKIYDDNASEKTQQLNDIADGIKDMTTAIQFATFEIDNDMNLIINHADKLSNTNFIFNEKTGFLEVEIND